MSSEDRYVERLTKLATIVLNKHFSYVPACVKEDLIQCAVIKAYQMTIQGNFNEKKGTWRNFLYTGMRNEMTNYLYRNSKEFACVDEIIKDTLESPSELQLPKIETIQEDLSRFVKYKEYIPYIVSYFSDYIGLNIGNVEVEYSPAIDVALLETLIVYVTWESLFNYNKYYSR